MLYFTALLFYLTKAPAKALALAAALEQSAPTRLLPEVLLLKALVFLSTGNAGAAADHARLALVRAEASNEALLSKLATADAAALFCGVEAPRLRSRTGLHALLLLADLSLRSADPDAARALLQEFLSQAKRLEEPSLHGYAFLLELELAERSQSPQRYFEALCTLPALEGAFHRWDRSLLARKGLAFLHFQRRFAELSTLDRTPARLHQDTAGAVEVDPLDWSPASRFDPLRNAALGGPGPDPESLLLRIKLAPPTLG